jgi:hypothetical protein
VNKSRALARVLALDNAPMKSLRLAVPALLCMSLAACSPELNWRQAGMHGEGLQVLFPCDPDQHARQVPLLGAPVRMEMRVCSAAGVFYALSFTDVSEPARVPLMLAELRTRALNNIGAPAAASPISAGIAGMTPQAQAVRVVAPGQLPDGAPVQLQAVFFAKGLRVYQASLLGARITPEASEIFFTGLKFSL